MSDMDKTKEKKTNGSPRWGKKPEPVTLQEVMATLSVMELRLGEISGIVYWLQEREVKSFVADGGNAAYGRMVSAAKAAINGLKAAQDEYARLHPPDPKAIAKAQ